MSVEGDQRYPEWREYPSAVSEGVFYAASTAEGVEGKARYRSGPTAAETMAVRAKGDFVPDHDYAAFSTMVFEELRNVLSDRLDASDFEDGTLLLRFAAFDRDSNWTVETAYDEVWNIVATTEFANLEVTEEIEPVGDNAGQESDAEPADFDADELEERLEGLDPEEREAVLDEIGDLL